MALVCSNPTVLRLFEITRLDTTFDIHAELATPALERRCRLAAARQRGRRAVGRRSASGSTTQPSSRWPFSSSAMIVRPTATAVPLSVCSDLGLRRPGGPVADLQAPRLVVGRVRASTSARGSAPGRAARPRSRTSCAALRAEVVDARCRRRGRGSPSSCRISSSIASSRSCSSRERRGSTKLNISTLSNWCTRKIPRVSARRRRPRGGSRARSRRSAAAGRRRRGSRRRAATRARPRSCRRGTGRRRAGGRSAARCRAGSRCRRAPPRARGPAG